MGMKVKDIYRVYLDKKDVPCPITEKLIQGGYQQEGNGYISYARQTGKEIDYRKAEPNQWWHLIESYCKRTDPEASFNRTIVCGELILWMAEVMHCVEKDRLNTLVDQILQSGIPVKRRKPNIPPVKFDRTKWNKEIQDLCFDCIEKQMEKTNEDMEDKRND